MYPNKTIIDGDTNSYPRNVTMDEFAISTVQTDVNETSQERVTSAIQGMLSRAYYELAVGQDDRYAGFKLLAGKIYQRYVRQTAGANGDKRIPLPPFDVMNKFVLSQLLDPQQGVPYAMRAVIRTDLGMGPETNAPAALPSGETNGGTNLPASKPIE
jgi:hypothetical protein